MWVVPMFFAADRNKKIGQMSGIPKNSRVALPRAGWAETRTWQ
jgi:hypothetical protein